MEQTNALEAALATASRDAEHRAAFYALLLGSEVYVIGQQDALAPPAPDTAEPAMANLAVQHWKTRDGRTVVPFFTGLAALRVVMPDAAGVVTLPARELFQLTRGAALILNPMSQPTMDFYPEDVNALLQADLLQTATSASATAPSMPAPSAPANAGPASGGIMGKLRAWLGRR